MSTQSPFSIEGDDSDRELVKEGVAGDRGALESLLRRHQPFIYNLAFRMVMVRQDAEDVTQEILIKVLTKLGTYDPAKAGFRTWLYRIVANHVINMKTRGYERSIPPLERYYDFVAAVPDEEPDGSPETQLVVADVATGCIMGVLLCLEREQRLAFILAVAFNVTDAQGSEIMGTTRDAFRKLLSRARARLHDSMQGNCGLVNRSAPCRCRNKLNGFMRLGSYGPDKISFVEPGAPSLREVVGGTLDRFNREIYADYARLLREHPFYRGPDMTVWLRQLVDRPDFKEILDVG
jgi:RNA polymerase sigma factor (sigma-70 family)